MSPPCIYINLMNKKMTRVILKKIGICKIAHTIYVLLRLLVQFIYYLPHFSKITCNACFVYFLNMTKYNNVNARSPPTAAKRGQCLPLPSISYSYVRFRN